MRTISITILILTAITFKVLAQESVNAAGGNSYGSNGSVSYSIGQLAFINTISSTGTLDEGVQQPFDIYPLNIVAATNIDLIPYVYPNPTSSFVVLKIAQSLINNTIFQLYDYTGKLLEKKQISKAETIIQMAGLPTGTYMLLVKNAIITHQAFKIIKN